MNWRPVREWFAGCDFLSLRQAETDRRNSEPAQDGMATCPEIMAGISIAAYSGRLIQPLGVRLAFSNRKPPLANTFDFGAGGQENCIQCLMLKIIWAQRTRIDMVRRAWPSAMNRSRR